MIIERAAGIPAPQISDGANAQYESPLFATLPGEIRQRIYVFSLSGSDDLSKAFDRQHHHYRPGHECRSKYDFRLLQTCKRIYHEARLLPISLNEMVFYLYRGPRSHVPAYSQVEWRTRYRVLNRDQQNAVLTVRVFAQQCYLESIHDWLDVGNRNTGAADLPLHIPVMTTKKFVLTFRRSDWWAWESPVMSNDQLGICPWRRGRTDWKQMEAEPLEGPRDKQWDGWGGQFQHILGLETLQIEFEAVETKKAQLERVVSRAKYWKFPLSDANKVLAWTGEVKLSTWEGAENLKEDNGNRPVRLKSIRQDSVAAEPATCTYVVMTMRWRVSQRENAD